MEADRQAVVGLGAARAVASIWGVLAGIGGLIHGIGEVLQGNVTPSGIVIASWTQGPIATNMGGEPGMTVVPNLLLTGILCIVVSLAVTVWAAVFVGRKRGGRVLAMLSLAMLLVGGGFGPPVVGMLAGWAGTGIGSPLGWWRTHLSPGLQRLLAALWPWLFVVCLLASLLLFIGSVILVYVFDVNNAGFFSSLFLFVVPSLMLTVVAGFTRDGQASERRA